MRNGILLITLFLVGCAANTINTNVEVGICVRAL